MRQPTVLHLFCGLGGGALGFKRAGFRGLAAIDCDQAACRDYERIVGEPATCADLATMSPDELRSLCGERPDVVFTSPPCRAFSGCLPAAKAKTAPYQQLSDLSLRGIWLALEAWAEPPPLIVLENVPRIQSRGLDWLRQITALLHAYGYTVKGSTHDCGEIGGLAQRRHRYLLVARHMRQVPELLYEPAAQRVRGIGEVIGALPIPTADRDCPGGPLHRLARLSGLNWLRLALIPAGKDWRALPEAVALTQRASRHNGGFGVQDWREPGHTVVGRHDVRTTWAGVADPRVTCQRREGSEGVQGWTGVCPTIIGAARHMNWPASVADPRLACDPRSGVYGVLDEGQASGTVIGNARYNKGAASVYDPRAQAFTHHLEAGSPVALIGPAADLDARSVLVIRAIDGTWHRPLTTLELAALQGLPTEINGAPLVLDGGSHSGWRQRIGNAVPPPAAEAIARQMARTLAASREGELLLSSTPVWVERRTS